MADPPDAYLVQVLEYLASPDRVGSMMLTGGDAPPQFVGAVTTQELEKLVVDTIDAGFYIRYATVRPPSLVLRRHWFSPSQVGRARARGGADASRLRRFRREAYDVGVQRHDDERRHCARIPQACLLELWWPAAAAAGWPYTATPRASTPTARVTSARARRWPPPSSCLSKRHRSSPASV
jgi:hypothetical protein